MMNNRIKAGAMSYALILSVVVGAFCMSLIWISAAYMNTRVSLKNKEKLVVNLLTGVKASQNIERFDQEEPMLINGDSVFVKKSHWGLFNYYLVRAVKNGRSLKRSYLSGSEVDKDLPTLYLSNNDRSLKLSGDTRLKGTVYAPNGRVERGYVQGENYENEKLVYGAVKESKKKLPAIYDHITSNSIDEFVNVDDEEFIDQLPLDSIFDFDQPTSRYSQHIPITLDQKIGGNIIIESSDSILVKSEANLENIILKAPVVRLEEGFQGNIQIFAEKKVVLEKDVQLVYPSSICLIDINKKFHRTDKAIVELNEGSALLGGMLILSESPDFRNLVKLNVCKGASLVGLIYNQGETMVKGKVVGSLITKKLYLNTKSSSYENHLLNAEIDGSGLPSYFLYPDWLEKYKSTEKKLKWL